MSSLPTVKEIQEALYSDQDRANQKQLFGLLFPDLNLAYDEVFQILSFLQETKVNAQVLPRVIRGVHNLSIGTGKGQVIVHVQRETINVQVREQDDDIRSSI